MVCMVCMSVCVPIGTCEKSVHVAILSGLWELGVSVGVRMLMASMIGMGILLSISSNLKLYKCRV